MMVLILGLHMFSLLPYLAIVLGRYFEEEFRSDDDISGGDSGEVEQQSLRESLWSEAKKV